jgi:hypothetical protein
VYLGVKVLHFFRCPVEEKLDKHGIVAGRRSCPLSSRAGAGRSAALAPKAGISTAGCGAAHG